MQLAAVLPFMAWEPFYVIMGSTAGALTGLTFVSISVLAGSRAQGTSRAVAAFGTPTVIHFGVVLLISVMLSAPWPALWLVSLLLGLLGLGGVGYITAVVLRMRRQDTYRPVLEDWLFHGAFPLVAYTGLVVAAVLLMSSLTPALFGIGAMMLLLLFTSIHNVWDSATYIAVEGFNQPNERKG